MSIDLSGFRQWVDDTRQNYHMNTDAYAETVDYTSYGGSARSIPAHCEESVEWSTPGGHDTEEKRDVLRLKCKKDAVTGINAPRIGDKVVRTVTSDSDSRPFVFKGDVEHISLSYWRLTFERVHRYGQGVE